MLLGRKCGVRLEPPALVVVYYDTTTRKLRERIMPVRMGLFGPTSQAVNLIAQDFKIRHQQILELVPESTLERMLRIIVAHLEGEPLEAILQKEQQKKKSEEIGQEKNKNEKKKNEKKKAAQEEEDMDTDLEMDDAEIPLDKIDSGDDSFW
ncbi:hypothetical protein AAG570_002307 [Ranatra chinensis]|uniref:Centrosomal protein of 19 kDa n=1 Tax=Ranatra chinensis TaxID=642074 RepID=A0ABD0Y768_9HEMI